jgi:hypothetical protein
MLVDELHDPCPGTRLFVAPDPGVGWRDPAFRGNTSHLGHHQTGTAHRTAAQMDQVPVVRHPVNGRVLVHRGHDNPIGEHQVANLERVEHRRDLGTYRDGRSVVRGGVPTIDRGHVLRIPQAQVVVGDPLTTGEHAEDELLGLHVAIAVGTLEPLQTGLGRPLQTRHLGPPLRLIDFEGLLQRATFGKDPGEGDRIFHRQLRTRTHREVSSVGGVTEEHHLAVMPALTRDRGELEPLGVVSDQGMTVEMVGEQTLACRQGMLIADPGRKGLAFGAIETQSAPGLRGHLHDERAPLR